MQTEYEYQDTKTAQGIRREYASGNVYHYATATDDAASALFLHREDGPAVEWAHGQKDWYLHDQRYVEVERWARAVLLMQRRDCSDATIDAFLKQVLQKQADECL